MMNCKYRISSTHFSLPYYYSPFAHSSSSIVLPPPPPPLPCASALLSQVEYANRVHISLMTGIE